MGAMQFNPEMMKAASQMMQNMSPEELDRCRSPRLLVFPDNCLILFYSLETFPQASSELITGYFWFLLRFVGTIARASGFPKMPMEAFQCHGFFPLSPLTDNP